MRPSKKRAKLETESLNTWCFNSSFHVIKLLTIGTIRYVDCA